ncbi:putative cyclin-D6-1-like [Hibiscus syriacus]|uniref:Cyclin-D6-1-like n=1 Tax=Hibiscus syriacus TaxID=106335 RepID=A0A6A3BD20_HIBSY|nr:putative cyclin-D6-1-like [Hibiscus syriacus]
MSSHHLSELDSTTDSIASSPRSDHHAMNDTHTRVRFICSFGGKILPRPHDNQLRIANASVKYQIPNEDLDALISVTTDEDLENMMEEYKRLAQNQNPRLARLRLFLFSKGDDDSRASSISSLLDGSVNREHWFLDALNSGANASGLESGRSEVSSIVSEVPDYLFGFDNSDEVQPRGTKLGTRHLFHDNISVSDPGSPAPVVSSSPFCSTSSAPVVPPMPDLPSVKIKPANPEPGFETKQNQTESFVEQPVSQTTAYSGNPPLWHYVSDSRYPAPSVQKIPVYYVPGPVQPVQIRPQFVQQYPISTGQVPVGYHQPVPGVGQAYRPVTHVDHYDPAIRPGPDGVKQPIYFGVRNAGAVPVYSGMVVPGGEEQGRSGSDTPQGRVLQ